MCLFRGTVFIAERGAFRVGAGIVFLPTRLVRFGGIGPDLGGLKSEKAGRFPDGEDIAAASVVEEGSWKVWEVPSQGRCRLTNRERLEVIHLT